MHDNNQQLNDAFNQLPESVQDFIMSDEVDQVVSKIVVDQKINHEQDFRDFVFALLVGNITSAEFTEAFQSEFNYSGDRVEAILDSLDEILTKILALLEAASKEVGDTGSNSGISPEAPIFNRNPISRNIPPSSSQPQTPAQQEAAMMPVVINQKTQVATPTIMDSRLTSSQSLPKENVIFSDAMTQASEAEKRAPQKPYTGTDPYREPLA